MVEQISQGQYIVRLMYKEINIEGPVNPSSVTSVYNLTTTSRVTNLGNRAVNEEIKLQLNHKITDLINYSRSYVVNESMIKAGTISYCFNKINDELLYGSSNFNRYSVGEEYHYAECLEKDWFAIEKFIPNHMLSGWRNLNFEHILKVEVSPGQTFEARMDVEFARVVLHYNAVLFFQALDYQGQNVVDSHIVDLTKATYGNNAIISQEDHITARVVISGVISHEVPKDVYLNINE